MRFKTILMLIMAVLVAVILIQNTEVVRFRFLFWELAMSRFVFLILFLMAGFLAGFISGKIIPKHRHVKPE